MNRTIVLIFALAALLSAAPALASPGDGGRTAVARPGSEAALKSGLDRSQLRHRLADAMHLVGGASGAFVLDLDANGDGALYGNDAHDRRTPASNEKLFTTAAFLDKLGPKAHLSTRAYAKGKLTGPGDATLDGDLVVVGDGDPAFGTRRFARAHDQPVTRVATLARGVARAGVKRITGRVLADDSIFDRRRRAGPDLSPLSGLSFNDGYDGGSYSRSPELVAARAMKAALRKAGVKVSGRVGHANLPDSTLARKPLAEANSPTVATLIEETNVPSNNFFAEMLLKRLAAADGSKGTRVAGAADVERFAKSVGTEIQAVDGLRPQPPQRGLAAGGRPPARGDVSRPAQRAGIPQLAADRRPRGHRRQPHARHRGRGQLRDQDGHPRRRLGALGLLQGGRAHDRLLRPQQLGRRQCSPRGPGPDRSSDRALSPLT